MSAFGEVVKLSPNFELQVGSDKESQPPELFNRSNNEFVCTSSSAIVDMC